MANFSEVLEELGNECGAQGCILWEKLEHSRSNDRQYTVLARHFPWGLDWYYLPARTYTEVAGQTRQYLIVNDLEKGVADGYPTCARLIEKGVRAFCAIPIDLEPKRQAVVNLYREDRPFGEDEVDRIQSLANTVPHLFKSVSSEVGLTLLRKVEDILRKQGIDGFQEALLEVTESFGALESAIYLRDPRSPGAYSKMASVWPWDWRQKTQYLKDDDGLTAYVLRNRKKIRFLDLAHFEEEVAFWEYEGVRHKTLDKLQAAAKNYFKTETPPPLSYIAVPIKDQGDTIGAIRCCVTRAGTHLFDNRHIEILEFVADQIGEKWGTRIALDRSKNDQNLFQDFTRRLDRLTAQAFRRIRSTDSPDKLFQSALGVLEGISGCGEALSIRLVDTKTRELYIANYLGPRWGDGGPRRRDDRLGQRWAEDGDCSGALAIRSKTVVTHADALGTGHQSNLFPDSTRLLHAPIVAGEDAIGVIDIRGFGPGAFHPLTEVVTSVLARHLGVYHHMFQNFKLLQEQVEKTRDDYDKQLQIYDDFHHQVSSPIHKAHVFAQQAVAQQSRPTPDVLRSIRSNARRAEQVAANIGHFVALTKGQPVAPKLTALVAKRLVPHLNELADDQQRISADEKSGLSFVVEESSFDALDRVTVMASLEFLDHALINLLDNASKYSYSGTTVTIRASVSGQPERRFWIAIINKGYPVEANDRLPFKERGYRGEFARQRRAEGRGIGLYIADRLMSAVGGRVEIIPTDSRGLNEFKLGWRLS
jgi:signal transduction histidine kinase